MSVSVCKPGTRETLAGGKKFGVSLINTTRYCLTQQDTSQKTISPELTFKADQETHKYKQSAANLSFTNN